MWVIKEINPTTFNVVSDLAGLLAAALLLFVLSSVYPRMVHASVLRGNGVDLDGIIRPPISFWDAATQSVRGHSSCLLIFGVLVISVVAKFSHTAADAFLEFNVVEVGSSQVCVGRVHAALCSDVFSFLKLQSTHFPMADSFSWFETSWFTYLQVNWRPPFENRHFYPLRGRLCQCDGLDWCTRYSELGRNGGFDCKRPKSVVLSSTVEC